LLQAAVLGLGTAGLASAAYQGYGMALDRRRYPAPGALVEADGRKLHLLSTPGAGPPLVIVAALSTPAIDWLPVQRALAPEMPVVLYDRGGLGWSDPGRRPRTVARMAEELHALLTAAGVEPPYVLAGHSLGGLIALVYTVRYREHVAGLALIDSSHPDMYTRLPAGEWFSSGRGELLLVTIRERLIPLGLVRLADDLGIRRQVTDRAQRIYPPDATAAGRAFLLSSRQRRAAVSELAHLGRSCDQARPCLTDLGTLPLAVLTSSEHDPSDAPGSPADRKRARWYATWSVLQAEFSGLARDSRHTIAGRAGHHMHRDDPELVADTLRDLVSRARRAGTAQPTALRSREGRRGRSPSNTRTSARSHAARRRCCATSRTCPCTTGPAGARRRSGSSPSSKSCHQPT
jgi:pimeloyl-ACP methyl ester carboxylesterase